MGFSIVWRSERFSDSVLRSSNSRPSLSRDNTIGSSGIVIAPLGGRRWAARHLRRPDVVLLRQGSSDLCYRRGWRAGIREVAPKVPFGFYRCRDPRLFRALRRRVGANDREAAAGGSL